MFATNAESQPGSATRPERSFGSSLVVKGELALVAAAPDQCTEIARVPAIEGKTWNHPVLVDGLLLVRNRQEMVDFKWSLAGD